MPKSFRLLKYEVDLWEKKLSDTKEALAADVNEVKNGSTATTRASEDNAVVKGIKSNASVSLASSPESVTCSHCGSVRNAGYEVEVHDAQVPETSSKSDDMNEDRRKQIEEEVRRQIWPKNWIINVSARALKVDCATGG